MAYLSSEFLAPYRGKRPKNAGVLFDVVYLRTYSRWLEDKKRRERWDETVERVVEYSMSLFPGTNPEKEAEKLYDYIFNLKVLPSGRTLWVGGTVAANKFPESQFNCSFSAIDELEIFGDLFHLLLCGCGVGFRVLPGDVANLPEFHVPAEVHHLPYKYIGYTDEHTAKTVWTESEEFFELIIGDSREGWVSALRKFLDYLTTDIAKPLYIVFDRIRPEGSRINGFGGLAPGHKGLSDMFKNLLRVITSSGGKLRPIDCVDIMNFIGKNVIVGGTRRSAQIGLGCPQDQSFVEAKKDMWVLKTNLQRAMSNNTVIYEHEPTLEELQGIFENIKNNGEPGFFNLSAAKKRKGDTACGINPCITRDSWINTDKGPRQVKDLIGVPYKSFVDNYKESSPKGFWSTGIKPVYRLSTDLGYSIKLTEDHKIFTRNRGWVEAKNLTKEDLIALNHLSGEQVWEGNGNFEEGWLLGNFIGDGCFSYGVSADGTRKYAPQLRYWGETKDAMVNQALEYANSVITQSERYSLSPRKVNKSQGCGYRQIETRRLMSVFEGFGIKPGEKVKITEEIEKASSAFYRGFLRGIFDADGSAQGGKQKGFSIRLSQSNEDFLFGIQRMLLRLGIVSKVYTQRRGSGMRLLPDSNRQPKMYQCKDNSELIISRSCMGVFDRFIGFSEPNKDKKLKDYLASLVKTPYQSKFEARLVSLEYLGEEEVFDCTVKETHRFDANGIIVHNCAEILLNSRGFCNLSTVNLMSFVKEGTFDLEGSLEAISLASRVCARMTNVSVSLPKWDKIQKEERLLGVSMTGVMDMLDSCNLEFDSPEAIQIFTELSRRANEEATEYAKEMGIPRPLLVTCVKPEGSLSQLPTVSSGLHRAYAPFYLRRIRVSRMDPVAKALKSLGVPGEEDAGKPERWVFSFPVKTEAKVSAAQEAASRQFERYLTLMDSYVDHNASCTLTIGEGEWEEIARQVHKNWDKVVACAFLPKDTTAYPQMPYEEITQDRYEELTKGFPDLSRLYDLVTAFENEDGIPEDELEIECSSGACPVR